MMAGSSPIGANLSGAVYRTTVMAGRGPAIHGFLAGQISRPCIDKSSTTSLYPRKEVVDGRAAPGHDDGVRTCPLNLALMGPRPAMTGEDRAFVRNYP
jgi:hypothetical protein